MKKIAVVTSNRAEYGILLPLIKKIEEDSELNLWLIVTGAHLSEKYGMTINQIREDGFPVYAEISIYESGNTAYDTSVTIADAVRKFAAFFKDNRPDMLVLLGDRTELLGVAIAAMNENIVIAHIHGGEVTEGAVDDCIRHALTKISYIHFAGTDIYRKRIIQLGENPDRVFNVGTLSAENILKTELLDEIEIRNETGIPADKKYAVVTLHPETVDNIAPKDTANLLCNCMRASTDLFFLITSSNSDAGGEQINEILSDYADRSNNAGFTYSLGMKRYLSAVRSSAFVLGNSSSGIVEAPILGVPTVNIGNRQKGRIMADTIINVPFESDEIMRAINSVKNMPHQNIDIYGDGKTSERMITIIKNSLNNPIDLKKGFYDLQEVNDG